MIVLTFLMGLVASIILFLLIYGLLILLGMLIPVNRKEIKKSPSIEIFIQSNGVHTDFIVPIKTSVQDWWKIINAPDFDNHASAKYLAFGWGDEGFYVDTPTWAELKFSTAVKAAFLPSKTLMHVTAYSETPKTSKICERLNISYPQYEHLCQFIKHSFYWNAQKTVVFLPNEGYTPNDNFYKAVGVYHAFNTCNLWVNKGLKKIGVRSPIWSPLDKGIFYQLKKRNKTRLLTT